MANMERVSSLFLAKTTYATLFVILAHFTGVTPSAATFHLCRHSDIGNSCVLHCLRPQQSALCPRLVSNLVAGNSSGIVLGVAALLFILQSATARISVLPRLQMTVLIADCGFRRSQRGRWYRVARSLDLRNGGSGVLGALLPFARAFLPSNGPGPARHRIRTCCWPLSRHSRGCSTG